MSDKKVKIIKNGPYEVSGKIPLSEKIIRSDGHVNYYEDGKSYEVGETYKLCRCGESKNQPFCDGSHTSCEFEGKETALDATYLSQADVYRGPDLILTDQIKLCAYARFCHKEHGNVWDLTENSDDPQMRKEAIEATHDCPAGRLIAWEKNSEQPILPNYAPSIIILQDPNQDCSGPYWVRGDIPLESAYGSDYEVRHQMTLCRCGKTRNQPFCDASHVNTKFKDH